MPQTYYDIISKSRGNKDACPLFGGFGYDSRSYFGGCYGAESRWVDLLAAQTGWEVINAGENGQEIPRREDEVRRISQISSIDLLIIMLGTNDLLQGTSPEITATYMETFLKLLPFEKRSFF